MLDILTSLIMTQYQSTLVTQYNYPSVPVKVHYEVMNRPSVIEFEKLQCNFNLCDK